MARKKQQRIPTDGGGRLTQNPFGALDGLEVLPGGPEGSLVESSVGPEKTSKRGKKNKNRGRVDIIRQTAHRGGKTVTVACNFPPIGELEKKELAKKMQKHTSGAHINRGWLCASVRWRLKLERLIDPPQVN